MKKILFSVSTLLAFGVMSAQEEPATTGFKQGDALITGSVSFNSQKQGDAKNTSFSIAPSAAYFVTSNIALGVNIGYRHSKSKVDNTDNESTFNSISPGIFGRYYFTPANKFSLFADVETAYVSTKSETNSGVDYKTTGFSASAGPGFNYFLTNHLALETVFGVLSYGSQKPENGDSTSNFSVNLNLSNIYLGVVYKF